MKFWCMKWAFGFDLSEGRYVQLFNYLPREARYLGYNEEWFDGWHRSFGFWFFNVAWDL